MPNLPAAFDFVRRRRSQIGYWAVSVSIGVCAAASYFVRFLRPISGIETLGGIGLSLYLVGLFSLIAYIGLFRFAWLRLRIFSRRVKSIWIIAALGIGALLVLVIPIAPPELPTLHQLDVIATGQKNLASQGSELWVQGLFRADGSTVPVSEFVLEGQWEIRDGIPLSYQNQPATLHWKGWLDGDAKLVLVSHPWSGIVQVRWDDHAQTVDLFADPGSPKVIPLPGHSATGLSIYQSSILGADAIIIGFVVFLVGVWLVTRPANSAPVQVSRWAWIGYALPSVVVWTIYLLAFWPGMMSPDSTDQWKQVLSGHFVDAHPAFHTMIIWLITRLWLSPAAVGLAQISALSALVGWGLALVRNWGAPRWSVWVACLLCALFPLNGLMAITFWKDIPYSIAVLALTLMVAQVIVSDGEWLKAHKHWIILGIVAASVALFRYNGLAAAFGTPLLLLVAYRRHWRVLLSALAVAIGGWLIIRGPVYDLVHVKPFRSDTFPMVYFVSQVGAHVTAGTPLTPDERAYLDRILPVAGGWPYNCYSVAVFLWPEERYKSFDWQVITADSAAFLRIYQALLIRNPVVNLRDLVCRASLVWEIKKPHGLYPSVIPLVADEHGRLFYILPPFNEVTLPSEGSLLPNVASQVAQIYFASTWNRWACVWRPALYLYLFLGGAALAALRQRQWKLLFITLPIILQSALLFVVIPAQDVRYQYPVFLVFLTLWPALYFSGWSQQRPVNDTAIAVQGNRVGHAG